MSRAVHMDATKPGDVGRTALCGYPIVNTDLDISRVTCRTCRQLFAKGATEPRARRSSKGATAEDAELQRALAPRADPPPRIDGPLWAGSCKGGEHRRCGTCSLCEWERDANLWGAPTVSAHNREHRLRKPENAPRWPSLAAAIVALCEYERHGRASPSAAGGILRRIELGPIDGIARADDPLMSRGGELVAVRVALEVAYPVGGHAKLSAATCRALLCVRTPGVVTPMPAYEDLAAEHGVTEGDVRALVRHGRGLAEEELVGRGLIPRPRGRTIAPAASAWQAEGVADG